MHPPKFTGITVTQIGPISKVKQHVDVFIDRGASGLIKVTALHPQMRNHRQLVAKPEQQVLAPPVDRFNRLPN